MTYGICHWSGKDKQTKKRMLLVLKGLGTGALSRLGI
jgi:hypothetical protein